MYSKQVFNTLILFEIAHLSLNNMINNSIMPWGLDFYVRNIVTYGICSRNLKKICK